MPKKVARVWVTTTQAAAELGCSPKYLRENRDLFKRGTHYRSLNPRAWRPTYRWHLKNLQTFMAASDDPPDPPAADKRSQSAES
jgi:hypothetical protein